MNKQDIQAFIEEMESIGDIWTDSEVEDVYGNSTLQDALADRKASLGMFFDNIQKIIHN